MSYLYVKIHTESGETDPEELTVEGRQEAIFQAQELIEQLQRMNDEEETGLTQFGWQLEQETEPDPE